MAMYPYVEMDEVTRVSAVAKRYRSTMELTVSA